MDPGFIKDGTSDCSGDTGVELSIVSSDVIKWAGLLDMDHECPLLVKGEYAIVQLFWVFQAKVQYQEVIPKYGFAVVESAKHTLPHGNNFGQNTKYILNQQWFKVYLRMEIQAIRLASQMPPLLGEKEGKPEQPIARILVTIQKVLPLCLEIKVECTRGWLTNACRIWQSCNIWCGVELAMTLHIKVAQYVTKICSQKTFLGEVGQLHKLVSNT